MIKITNPADCCGCSACASICSHDAIKMKPDALGFLYPEVDETLCTNCGLCEKICAFNDNYDTSLNLSNPIAYGARHKDSGEIMKSRSGAVFAAISDYVLENGGIVYGAGYTDHFRVVHKRAVSKTERDEFRGSKYVQSDMNTVFRQVRNDLRNGLTVLFSGTPCQTSGLISFIGNKLRDNLVLIDLVCHGVPGPYFWRDYISLIEKEEGSQVIGVNFRDKEQFGWADHRETFTSQMGKGLVPNKNWFTKTFYQHIMFRHSCGKCHFCNTKRPSDITIADFWGWEKQDPTINIDNKGLNLVLINTKKGIDVFEAIKDKLQVIHADPIAYLQPNLKQPSHIHKLRMKFEDDYIKYGFEYVYNHVYDERPYWKQIASKIYVPLLKMINK